MRLKGRIVGDKYYPIVLDFPQNIDIDEKWQFELGKILIKEIKKFEK